MPKKRQTVWVVMHYEVMGMPDQHTFDAMQFHVSSSRRAAEAYLRKLSVENYSWWQVHPHEVDSKDFDEGIEVYYYSHRGTPLKSPPHKRAIAAYQRFVAKHPEWYATAK